jgi:chitinase
MVSVMAGVLALGNAWGQGAGPAAPKRIIYYYQTQYFNGNYVSLAPISNQINPHTHKPVTTDVMVAAFHLGFNTDNTPYIHLNDNVPGDPMFDVMWGEVATLQAAGVTVRMMLGGAAQGSYQDLFSQWTVFYPILQQTLQTYNLNGIDLDVEENVSLANIQKLIDQLSTDFGSKFVITLSPVASALWGGANLSGFNYKQLYTSPEGAKIAWFNGQFYSGFATLANTADYDKIVAFGFPAQKVVGGMIGNPADGSGYVSINTVATTATALVAKYPQFGGVASWEYFNTLPGGLADPVKWAALMAKAMGK